MHLSRQFMTLFLAELSLMGLAFVLAWFGFYDRREPLTLDWLQEKWSTGLLWGIVATIPLAIAILSAERINWRSLQNFLSDVKLQIAPLFQVMPTWQLGLLSIAAGLCEEMLFRWVLQGGLASILGGNLGNAVGLGIGALVFGVGHYLSTAYAVFATVMGLYLGIAMIVSETWLVPAVCHALYDLFVLLYLTGRLPWKRA